MSPDNNRERGAQRGPAGSYPKIEHSGSSGRRGKESAIAQIEAPHNPDEEEAYLREAIKASLQEEEVRKVKGESTPEKPKMSAEATDLLIDFMDDFDATGNTLSAPPAGNEWALAPAPAANQSNQWAAPAPDNSWAMAPAPTPVAVPAPQPSYDQFSGANAFAAAPANPFAPAPTQQNFAMPTPAPATQQNFAMPAPAPSADPFAAPAFAQAPAVPATPQTASMTPAPAYGQDPFAPPPAQASADPFAHQPAATAPSTTSAPAPTLTMKSLNGSDGLLGSNNAAGSNGGTLADKALQNLMGSIESFGITSSAAKPPDRKNPFDSNNIMSNTTLGEMKAKGTGAGEKKPVMNAAPNSLVVAGGQSGNWGGYAQQQPPSQYNMGGSMGGSMMQPPAGQGYQQYPMAGGYQQQQQQQPQMGYGGQMGMGQQPMQQQQQYGAYGAPAPPQYQQQQQQPPQWGAPTYQ